MGVCLCVCLYLQRKKKVHVCVRSRERDAGYVYRQRAECVFMCTSGETGVFMEESHVCNCMCIERCLL